MVHTYVPSLLNLPPTSYPQGCHRAPDLSAPAFYSKFALANFACGNVYVSILLSVPPIFPSYWVHKSVLTFVSPLLHSQVFWEPHILLLVH